MTECSSAQAALGRNFGSVDAFKEMNAKTAAVQDSSRGCSCVWNRPWLTDADDVSRATIRARRSSRS
jgi:hypothetical protein